MKPYEKPDMSQWPEGDPRRNMTGFDEDFLRKQYNEWMPLEQPPIHDWTPSKVEQVVCDVIRLHDGECLDVGCGNGRLLVYLKKNNCIDGGMGIDISDAMVANAKQSAVNNLVLGLSFMRVAIETFYASHYYDVILATEMLEHVYHLRGLLERLVEWLDSGGVFVGTVPLEHNCDALVHLHYFSEDSLRDLLSNFFGNVVIRKIDNTGEGEYRLVFACRKPRKGNDAQDLDASAGV